MLQSLIFGQIKIGSRIFHDQVHSHTLLLWDDVFGWKQGKISPFSHRWYSPCTESHDYQNDTHHVINMMQVSH